MNEAVCHVLNWISWVRGSSARGFSAPASRSVGPHRVVWTGLGLVAVMGTIELLPRTVLVDPTTRKVVQIIE